MAMEASVKAPSPFQVMTRPRTWPNFRVSRIFNPTVMILLIISQHAFERWSCQRTQNSTSINTCDLKFCVSLGRENWAGILTELCHCGSYGEDERPFTSHELCQTPSEKALNRCAGNSYLGHARVSVCRIRSQIYAFTEPITAPQEIGSVNKLRTWRLESNMVTYTWR